MDFAAILDKFEEALALESELGTRTVEIDRALLREPTVPSGSLVTGKKPGGTASVPSADATERVPPVSYDSRARGTRAPTVLAADATERVPPVSNHQSRTTNHEPRTTPPDFAFLLECEPTGQVAELLPKMSAAIGYGPDGVKINDPSARVLIVLGSAALQKWLPGVKALPGQWVKRGETPALVTASPTKTFRFFANDPAKIHALKKRLWADLQAALAKLGKKPPPRA